MLSAPISAPFMPGPGYVIAAAAALVLAIARRRRMRPPPVLPPLLEHINLNIPSEALARDFYVGLGGAVNPKTSNWRQLHINAPG